MDTLSRSRRSELMRRIRTRNTRPEQIVRRALHRAGYRFRLQRKDLPGTPDIVLPKWKTAIFVHGCFWHGCPSCDRGRRRPKTNLELWDAKLASNRLRDERVRQNLEAAGWQTLVVWQCETANEDDLERQLSRAIRGEARR